jgi:hypothetical protein
MRLSVWTADACRAAATAILCGAVITSSPPSHAAYLDLDVAEGSSALERSAAKAARTTYPLLQSLNSDTFTPFERSIGNVLSKAEPSAVAQTLDLFEAALQSVPADRASDLTLASCTPSATLVPESLLAALPKSTILAPLEKGLCVPPLESLESAATAAASADPLKLSALTKQARLRDRTRSVALALNPVFEARWARRVRRGRAP